MMGGHWMGQLDPFRCKFGGRMHALSFVSFPLGALFRACTSIHSKAPRYGATAVANLS